MKRQLKSYIKQVLVFALLQVGRGDVIYRNKYTPLPNHEYLDASTTLQGLRDNIVCPPVLAITVTYGERLHLLRKTVDSAFRAGATNVLIVNNGLASKETESLNSTYADSTRISICRLEINQGSASGFHAGLMQALESDFDYYWLLDDDNDVIQGNVRTMVDSLVNSLQTQGVAAVSAVRKTDRRHQRMIEGVPAARVYPPKGAFLYFDALTYICSYLPRRRRRDITNRDIHIPSAPYGGLLLHRSTVDKVGLPNTQLGLYEDDTEWTARISSSGDLLLHNGVVIEDLEGKYTADSEGRGPLRLLSASDQVRVFFGVRNRIHFEARQLRGWAQKVRYTGNKLVYLRILTANAKKYNAEAALASIRTAVSAGEDGDLRTTFLSMRNARYFE